MSITCTRKIHFDAAHRVMQHESKCKMLHGHRYVVEASFSAPELDKLGRVIDFGAIYEILGKWINENFDHNVILWEKDRALGEAISSETGQQIYYLPYNPTAENIAHYLFSKICPELFKEQNVACCRIILHETVNCYAEIQG